MIHNVLIIIVVDWCYPVLAYVIYRLAAGFLLTVEVVLNVTNKLVFDRSMNLLMLAVPQYRGSNLNFPPPSFCLFPHLSLEVTSWRSFACFYFPTGDLELEWEVAAEAAL